MTTSRLIDMMIGTPTTLIGALMLVAILIAGSSPNLRVSSDFGSQRFMLGVATFFAALIFVDGARLLGHAFA